MVFHLEYSKQVEQQNHLNNYLPRLVFIWENALGEGRNLSSPHSPIENPLGSPF